MEFYAGDRVSRAINLTKLLLPPSASVPLCLRVKPVFRHRQRIVFSHGAAETRRRNEEYSRRSKCQSSQQKEIQNRTSPLVCLRAFVPPCEPVFRPRERMIFSHGAAETRRRKGECSRRPRCQSHQPKNTKSDYLTPIQRVAIRPELGNYAFLFSP